MPSGRQRSALELTLDFTNVSVGRDFNLVLPEPTEPEAEEARASLTGLLRQVRATWVEDALEEMVPAGIPLDVSRSAPDLAATPKLHDGIAEIFDRAERSLLILGGWGSGKTTTLLDLGRTLVERAEADPAEPVPVVFNLGSWGIERLSLAEWMVGQLSEFYRVPRHLGRRWLRSRRLLPLLDGLDEIDPLHQESCVVAINRFVAEGVPGLAVCCNDRVYDSIGTPLQLNSGFRLQPLSSDQIMAYVKDAGPELSTLHDALQTDPWLQELAQTPLMLRVMMAAYKGVSPEDLVREDLASLEGRRTHVFDSYVQRALMDQQEDNPRFNDDQIMSGMSWLAQRMRQTSQTMFLVERLQPTWLEPRSARSLYILASRLVCGLALGLTLGLILEAGVVLLGGGFIPTAGEVVTKLMFGLTFGAIGGAVSAVIDMMRLQRSSATSFPLRGWLLMVPYVSAFGLIGGGVVTLITDWNDLPFGVSFGIIWGTIFWVFFGSPRGRTGLNNDIAVVEALRFSSSSGLAYARKGAAAGFGIGALIELFSGLSEPLNPIDRTLTILLVGVLGAVAGGVLGFVLGGLQRAYVDTKRRPNEGLFLSLRNMALGGTAVMLATAVLLIPMMLLLVGSWWGGATGITGALFMGMLAVLWYGGFDVLQHYIVRALLVATGAAPQPLVAFLETAVRLGFLQRVGGGYIFVNDFVLSRFAAYEDEREAPLPTSSGTPAVSEA